MITVIKQEEIKIKIEIKIYGEIYTYETCHDKDTMLMTPKSKDVETADWFWSAFQEWIDDLGEDVPIPGLMLENLGDEDDWEKADVETKIDCIYQFAIAQYESLIEVKKDEDGEWVEA